MMNAYTHTEDQLVAQPAIGLFAELGWQTVSAMEETFGATVRHPPMVGWKRTGQLDRYLTDT